MLAQRGADLTREARKAAEAKETKEAKSAAPAPQRKRKLSFNEKHQIETLPKTIAGLHDEARVLQQRLDDPDLFARDRVGVRPGVDGARRRADKAGRGRGPLARAGNPARGIERQRLARLSEPRRPPRPPRRPTARAPFAPSTWIAPAPIGPVRPGSLAEKIATSGTPSAAARCRSPVSTPTTNEAPAISRATCVERRAVRHTRARRRRGDPRRALALGLGAERHDQIDAGPERRREHPPVRLRPFLVGARGRVQQHAVGRGGRLGQSRAVEAEVRRAVRRVAQRQRRSARGFAQSRAGSTPPRWRTS